MESWGQYLARGVERPAAPLDARSAPLLEPPTPQILEEKLLFLDYDSTLNPGQGNAPLTEERSAMLGGYLRRWREDLPKLKLYVLTVSNPSVKRRRLVEAGLIELFDDVLSTTMPELYDSKGEYLVRFLDNAGVPGRAALHADDSYHAIESILNNPTGLKHPVCHTLRLPYGSRGLTEKDMDTIATEFLYRQTSESDFFSAHSFDFNGERHLDVYDKPTKCMLDGMDVETRKQVIQSNKEQDHYATWLQGRPDYVSLAE